MKLKDVKDVLTFAAFRPEPDDSTAPWSKRFPRQRSLLLNFDQTWRLRYGVGDIHHHKFWGQILRWGTGENLRAGDEFIRVGTDKLSYTSGQEVVVLGKLLDERHRPLARGQHRGLPLGQREAPVFRVRVPTREPGDRERLALRVPQSDAS